MQFAHAEFENLCGTNGLQVMTFNVTQGGTALSVAAQDEGFVIVVP